MSKLLKILLFLRFFNLILCSCDKADGIATDTLFSIARDLKDQVVESVHNDCETHDIFRAIPLYKLLPLLFKFLAAHPSEKVEIIISSPHFASILSGLMTSILNQHLFGFLAGVGEHVADVVDHYVDISKTVQGKESSLPKDLWSDLIGGGKPIKRNAKSRLPLEDFSDLIRKTVEFLPAEKVKHCYKNKYQNIARLMKEYLNSTEFKGFLEKLHKSDFQKLPFDLDANTKKLPKDNPKVAEKLKMKNVAKIPPMKKIIKNEKPEMFKKFPPLFSFNS